MRKLTFPFLALLAVMGACDERNTPLEPDPNSDSSLDAAAVAGNSSPYSETILTPLPGAEYIAPHAINDRGVIVGLAIVEDAIRPVVWEDGRPIELQLSAWAEGYATDVNNTGNIVGHDDELGAVMWSNGELIALGVYSIGSLASGINQHGEIVGTIEYDTSPPGARGFLWTRGQLTELASLGDSQYCSAADINEAGQIVGVCSSRASLWNKSNVIDLELGSDNSVARAINDRGQIVGHIQVAETEYRAFLWDNGEVVDLPSLGGMVSSAADINDIGQIVGTSQTQAGVTHAVLWEGGSLIDLGPDGGESSVATAINNSGQVVGIAGENAVVWDRQ